MAGVDHPRIRIAIASGKPDSLLQFVKDKKKQIRSDASHGKVVVAVPGIIEMKTAQFSFVDQNAYDLFQIGIGQVMSQINQYVGLFAQFGAEQVRRSPVL